MKSVLSGGRGKKVNVRDFEPVTIHAVAADGEEGDLWYAAEEYGSVGMMGDVYEVATNRGAAKDMSKDRRFDVLKVVDRKVR